MMISGDISLPRRKEPCVRLEQGMDDQDDGALARPTEVGKYAVQAIFGKAIPGLRLAHFAALRAMRPRTNVCCLPDVPSRFASKDVTRFGVAACAQRGASTEVCEPVPSTVPPQSSGGACISRIAAPIAPLGGPQHPSTHEHARPCWWPGRPDCSPPRESRRCAPRTSHRQYASAHW